MNARPIDECDPDEWLGGVRPRPWERGRRIEKVRERSRTPRPPRPAITSEQIAHERAVLGAAIAGSLGLRDLLDLPLDAWLVRHHADVALALEVMLDARERDPRLVPGRLGLPLEVVLDVCRGAGISPVGTMIGRQRGAARPERYAIGYLPTLARKAPTRPKARASLLALVAAAAGRVEAANERKRALRSVAELVPSSLRALSAEERAAVFAEIDDARERARGKP